MKNVCFLSICLLLAIAPLNAQLEFGVKAGLNMADIYSAKVLRSLGGGEPAKQRFSTIAVVKPQLGLWLNYSINNNFSLQPELLFTQKAWRPDGVLDPATLSLNYISLPILLNYHYKNWRLEAGPEISFLLNQSLPEIVGGPSIGNQKIELGVNAGIRYLFDDWNLGIRYCLDYSSFAGFYFTDMNGEPLSDSPVNVYHQGWQLTVGMKL